MYLKNDDPLISLDDYVDNYCRSTDIPIINIQPISLFTYYLIEKDLFLTDINGNFVECNIYLINKIFKK